MFIDIWEWIKEKVFGLVHTFYEPFPNIENNINFEMLNTLSVAAAETGFSMEQMANAVGQLAKTVGPILYTNDIYYSPHLTKNDISLTYDNNRCKYCHTKIREDDRHCQE